MTDSDLGISVLAKAQSLIHGRRQREYGTPGVNLAAIAALWTTYLDTPVTVDDVCIMMTLLKIARVKTGEGYHHDSVVDACGYLGLLELVQDRSPSVPPRGPSSLHKVEKRG